MFILTKLSNFESGVIKQQIKQLFCYKYRLRVMSNVYSSLDLHFQCEQSGEVESNLIADL